MNKRPVIGFVVFILMTDAFASPPRLAARKIDHFTGLWRLNVEKSDKLLPAPREVRINANEKTIRVREVTVNQNGVRTTVTISANFSGKDYPVVGSPLADAAAYKRIDSHTIKATVKKQREVVVSEKLVVSEDGRTLTASFEDLPGAVVFDKH
jgi:hypothetical protein